MNKGGKRIEFTDGARIEAALHALGQDAYREENKILSYNKERGAFIIFNRGEDGTFAVNGDTSLLAEIYRKYTEIGKKGKPRKGGR